MVRCHACGLLHCAVLRNLSSHGFARRCEARCFAGTVPAHTALPTWSDRLLMGSSLTTEGLRVLTAFATFIRSYSSFAAALPIEL